MAARSYRLFRAVVNTAVDEDRTRLLWVAGERARTFAYSAEGGGDAAGDAPPTRGDQDARHEQDGEGIDGGSGLI